MRSLTTGAVPRSPYVGQFLFLEDANSLRSHPSAALVQASQASWVLWASTNGLTQGAWPAWGFALSGSGCGIVLGFLEGPDLFPEGGQSEGEPDGFVGGQNPYWQKFVVGHRAPKAVIDEEEILLRGGSLNWETGGSPTPHVGEPSGRSGGQGGRPQLVRGRVPVTCQSPRNIRQRGRTFPSTGCSASSIGPGCRGASRRR